MCVNIMLCFSLCEYHVLCIALLEPWFAASVKPLLSEHRPPCICLQVPLFKDAEDFLQHVAAARGKLRRGGTVDTAAAARIVLTDWNDGRIPFYTEPPKRDSGGHAAAAIVQDFATDFSADQVCRRCNPGIEACASAGRHPHRDIRNTVLSGSISCCE